MADLHRTNNPDFKSSSGFKPSILPIQDRLELATQRLILPWALKLSQFDPLAEVYVAGSGAGKKSPLSVNVSTTHGLDLFRDVYLSSGPKPNSDLDVIVFSPRLINPQKYIQLLEELKVVGTEFKNQFGYHPVFFSHASSKQAKVSLAKLLHGENVIPIHFLYYPNRDLFYAREGDLSSTILRNTSPVVKQDLPPINTPAWSAVFEAQTYGLERFEPTSQYHLRWEIECAVADFVLNFTSETERISHDAEFLKAQFADTVTKALRNFAPEANGAPPANFGHSLDLQCQTLELAADSVGRILLGDFSVERSSILTYGRLLLEACPVSHRHREAIHKAQAFLRKDAREQNAESYREVYWPAVESLSTNFDIKDVTPPPGVYIFQPERLPHCTGCSPAVEELFRSVQQVPPGEKQALLGNLSSLLTKNDIVGGLASEHTDVRARALECWANSSVAPELKDSILNLVECDETGVRAWACWALSKRAPQDVQVAAAIAGRVSDVEVPVGLAALEAIKNLSANWDQVLPSLEYLLELQFPLYQKWYLPQTFETIKAMGPHSRSLLKPCLDRLQEVLARQSGNAYRQKQLILETAAKTLSAMGPVAVRDLLLADATEQGEVADQLILERITTEALKCLPLEGVQNLCLLFPEIAEHHYVKMVINWHTKDGPEQEKQVQKHLESWDLDNDRY